ncbi:trypsin-like peptidase domain-containing protein [Streptomyces sp. NPDC050703]|uniref:nSTAND1 domain-containing NTPase n=1 Tax=Streptomyces sp. NPDC050703 TaxID=3157218 RepID=UPI00341D8B84
MAAVRKSDVLAASQARVYSADGEVVGAGFLVADDVVCTCAHVVVRALGARETGDQAGDGTGAEGWAENGTENANGAGEAPPGALDLDFPLLPGRPRARAAVVSWRTRDADVALLRLSGPVEGARPAPLVDGTEVWGHTFRTMGFPAGAGQGVWAYGTLRGEQGTGWVQMDTDEPGPRVTEGFSGAPVWDHTQNGVVGMTVAAHLGEPTAYLLPSAELVDETVLEPCCPYQGLAAFTEDGARFFHGRDADTERLLTAVRTRALTLVAGPSGCGKSSLARAGLLPRLRASGADVTELRPVPGVPPAAVVARALAGVLEPDLGEIERLVRAEELAGLLDAGRGIASELRDRVLSRSDGSRRVLFVDQFEEYVAGEPAAARTLLGLLAELAGEGLRVIATARPDSLDSLVTAGTSDLVSDAVQFLAPLATENLAQAVTAPIDTVPGLWFEAGLPERIVADAGDEPGRMPLVQFALTELWRLRSRAMLTHAAYDELGGVAGALVGYADHAYGQLSEADRVLARRLLVQLARPGDGDTFTRRPARTTDLAPEVVACARKLARDKLVVLSHAPGSDEHEEFVDLAHEALTTHWPRLRQWLVDSRDFRVWQEQVRADLDRWRSQEREHSRLLGGTDLTEAERRLGAHTEAGDISAAEREYIDLSRRHARRGSRLRRAAVAVLGVLTVLAVVLAFTTYQSLRRTEDQLRTQAADLIARTADERPASDPATALQLALAAWHAKPTPRARQALMNQYVRGQFVTGAHPSLWHGGVDALTASEDGRVLVVRSKPPGGGRSALTVVTGASEGRPRARRLSGVPDGDLATAVSPDGRQVAVTAGRGEVRLWRTGRGGTKHPKTLESGPHTLRKKGSRAILDFSGDGGRLLLFHPREGCDTDVTKKCGPAFVDVWDTDIGGRGHVTGRIELPAGMDDVAFTADADSVATLRSATSVRDTVDVRDLRTGRRLYSRRMATPVSLLAGGEVAVQDDGRALELGRTPGRSYRVPARKEFFLTDATTRYELRSTEPRDPVSTGQRYVEHVLVDVRTGRSFHTRVPASGDASVVPATVAALPRKGGGLRVFAAVGSDLVETRAEPVGGKQLRSEALAADGEVLSPDGQLFARIFEGRLAVLDASRRRLRSTPLPEPAADHTVMWTADSRRLVLWSGRDGLNRSYAADDLGSRPVALDGTLPGFDPAQGVVAVGGSEVAVLSRSRLARVDAADGRVTTRPFSVYRGAGARQAPEGSYVGAQLVARPEHAGQVAVHDRSGAILLWDLRAPRRVAVLRGAPVSYGPAGVYSALAAFDPAGRYLAVVNDDAQARLWDVPRGKQLPPGIPWTDGKDGLVGPTRDGRVMVLRGGQLHFVDPGHEGNNLAVPVMKGVIHADGDQLVVDSGAVRQKFDLRPEAQFRHLCEAAGRDYTDAERKLLPEGTPDGPPCP